MKTNFTKAENNLAEFIINFTEEEFKDAIAKAYKQNSSQFNIPGFRKGKVPQKMIEQYYGVEVFYEDAVNLLLPDAYDKAVEEFNLDAVGRPSVDVTEIGDGKGVTVEFKVAIKPVPEVKNYKGIEIEIVEHTVTDSDVDSEIEKLRDRNARIIDVEDRAAANGDTVTIDFEGFVDGVAFPGGKGEGFKLELGSGQFIPGFEPQVEGMKIDEEKTIDVAFPSDYHAEELAGKAAQFNVKLHAISAKELPVLDDEFAKDVSEFDTLAELRADAKAKLEESAQQAAKSQNENAVIEKLVEANDFDIPEEMIESQLENMANDYNMRLGQQGLTLEKYLEITGTTIEDFNEQNKPMAISRVKANILLEAVTKAENIEATDADVEAEYVKMAEMYGMDAEKIQSYFPAEMLKKDLAIQKTIEFLLDNAKVKKAEAKNTAAKKPAAKKADDDKKAEKKPAVKKTTTKKAPAKKDAQ
ncbi:MAG: trigger factor [Eubacteriales bacterium]|nr:trigger factor [Eubacteriales bacterium]